MRAARYSSQLGFQLDEETEWAMTEFASSIENISAERVNEELCKLLLTDKPRAGIELLVRTGIASYVLPESPALRLEVDEHHHHKDVYEHSLTVLEQAIDLEKERHPGEPADLTLRLAALLHDIGKPATKRFEKGHGWTFHGHDPVGEKMTPRMFKQLRLPLNEHMKYVAKLVALHLRPISLTKEDITDSAMRRLLFDAGEDLEDLMILCESDITSKNKQKVKRYLENFELVKLRLKEVEEKDRIRNWQPPIDGEEIMRIFNLPPSRNVGTLKTAVREAILDGIIPNTYDAAYEYMMQKAAEMGIEKP